jgi:hypothetical protein
VTIALLVACSKSFVRLLNASYCNNYNFTGVVVRLLIVVFFFTAPRISVHRITWAGLATTFISHLEFPLSFP